MDMLVLGVHRLPKWGLVVLALAISTLMKTSLKQLDFIRRQVE